MNEQCLHAFKIEIISRQELTQINIKELRGFSDIEGERF